MWKKTNGHGKRGAVLGKGSVLGIGHSGSGGAEVRSQRSGVVQEVVHADGKAREQSGRGYLPQSATHGQLVTAPFQAKHIGTRRLRVNDPVFLHAMLLVKVALLNAVPLPAAQGNDFGHQVGRSHD